MTVKMIPARYVYKCDRCPREYEQVESVYATGRYPSDCPPGWLSINFRHPHPTSNLINAASCVICDECAASYEEIAVDMCGKSAAYLFDDEREAFEKRRHQEELEREVTARSQ